MILIYWMEMSISFSLHIISERNSQELKKNQRLYLYAVKKAMEIKALSPWTVLFVTRHTRIHHSNLMVSHDYHMITPCQSHFRLHVYHMHFNQVLSWQNCQFLLFAILAANGGKKLFFHFLPVLYDNIQIYANWCNLIHGINTSKIFGLAFDA